MKTLGAGITVTDRKGVKQDARRAGGATDGPAREAAIAGMDAGGFSPGARRAERPHREPRQGRTAGHGWPGQTCGAMDGGAPPIRTAVRRTTAAQGDGKGRTTYARIALASSPGGFWRGSAKSPEGRRLRGSCPRRRRGVGVRFDLGGWELSGMLLCNRSGFWSVFRAKNGGRHAGSKRSISDGV